MAKKANTQAVPSSFEAAVEEIESVLGRLEADDVGLDEAITRYERGVYLLGWCRATLQQAEQKVEQLAERSGRLATESAPAADADDESPEQA